KDSDIQRLRALGYEPYDLAPLPQGNQLDIDPEYHTYVEFTTDLQNLAAQYPNLCRLDSIGHATQFPRTIWCLKLSDNVYMEEDEPAVLYVGTHHACEPMGGEMLMVMANHFLQNYGVDPQITEWMDNFEIFMVPLVNPDGHYAVTSGIDLFWRKNARDLNNNGIYYEFVGGTWWTDPTEGIDLNRNYNWYWDMGGSPDPRSYYYRGSSPFSEDETLAIRNLAAVQRVVCGISFHSYGEVVIYPWSFDGQPAPDQNELDNMAQTLASRFIRDSGGSYGYYTESAKSGQCRNWLYGFTGALFFCVEVNPYPVFLPPGSQMAERTQRYMQGAIYLLERMGGPGITGHVRDAVTGMPLAAQVEIQGRISAQVRPRFAEPQYGRFTRLLNNGIYTVLAGLPGYQTQRVANISVNNGWTELELDLVPIAVNALPQNLGADNRLDLSIRRSDGTSVEFEVNVSQATDLELQIFDLLGRKVVSVPPEHLPVGVHRIEVGVANLPSGMYLCRAEAGGNVKIAKIAVVH
ncbi:MAG: M14 family zinc carboxypeptidase, partial [bacterium]